MLTLPLLLLAPALTAALPAQAGGGAPSFDGTWTFTVDGQTVQADADGNFTLSNVAAPDLHGPGGPGTLPDFLSDHWLRVFGTSAAGVQPIYAVSAPFKIVQGETFLVQGFTLTTTPPGLVETNEITLDATVLTRLGETAQAQVIGTLSDGVTMLDVTQLYTDYTTSNAAVATVNAAGQVTAAGLGHALIAAVTDGAIAVAEIEVSPGDPLTTVAGFVVLEDGTPVADADVQLVGLAGADMSAADGSFSIPGAATGFGPISAVAGATVGGSTYTGSAGPVDPVPGGITDLGLITLMPPKGVLVWDDDFLTAPKLKAALAGLGLDVTVSATLPADLTPFQAIYHHLGAPGVPIHPLTQSEQLQLAAFVEAGFGLHLTGLAGSGGLIPAQQASIESLLNLIVIGPKPDVGAFAILNPPTFNPGAVAGISTTPNPLTTFCSCLLQQGLGGIAWSDPHAFLRGPFTSYVAGAAWDCSDMILGRGRVTLLMVKLTVAPPAVLPLLVENMQHFFEGTITCP